MGRDGVAQPAGAAKGVLRWPGVRIIKTGRSDGTLLEAYDTTFERK